MRYPLRGVCGVQGPAPKIQRAADVGRTAWMPGSNVHGQDRVRPIAEVLHRPAAL